MVKTDPGINYAWDEQDEEDTCDADTWLAVSLCICYKIHKYLFFTKIKCSLREGVKYTFKIWQI